MPGTNFSYRHELQLQVGSHLVLFSGELRIHLQDSATAHYVLCALCYCCASADKGKICCEVIPSVTKVSSNILIHYYSYYFLFYHNNIIIIITNIIICILYYVIFFPYFILF